MASWKRELQMYGTVRAKSMARMAEDNMPPEEIKKVGSRGRNKERTAGYLSKEQADICLNCKKKKCTGDPDCFKKRRKEAACDTGQCSSGT